MNETLQANEPAIEKSRKLLQEMLVVRRFEEACAQHYTAGSIRGFLHLYIGQEAVATGFIDQMKPDEAIVATYREHAHAIAKGLDPGRIMAEMFGKLEGCAMGRGGSMHIFSAGHRFYGGNAIVAGGMPLACGLALADKMQGRNRATVCFFGEGAVAEGEFHESMNLAELWKLPVLFVCENNLYAMGTHIQRSESELDLMNKADGYRVPATRVDGMDVMAVNTVATDLLGKVRTAGYGPHFLECQTYRFRAHSMFDAELYRNKSEVDDWKQKDPISAFAGQLKAAGQLNDDDLRKMNDEADRIVNESVAFAQAGTLEPVEQLTRHVLWEGESL